jgi:hypothetical protein
MMITWILNYLIILKLCEAVKFGEYLKDQFFVDQNAKVNSKIIYKLPKVSGLYCDIKISPLPYYKDKNEL